MKSVCVFFKVCSSKKPNKTVSLCIRHSKARVFATPTQVICIHIVSVETQMQ